MKKEERLDSFMDLAVMKNFSKRPRSAKQTK